MPEIESPVATLIRLLEKNLRVVKDDGSLASVLVSQEWYDRELFRNYDGQVTVGLDRSEDQKIGFSATARRQVGYLHVNVWTVDKSEQGITGRKMRDQMCTEVNRVIREKRNKPNETIYNFVSVGPSAGTHKIYHAASSVDPEPTSPDWTELTAIDYERIWYSDDDRFIKSASIDLQHALLLFRLKIDPDRKTVKKTVLKFEGYGTAPAGSGTTIKVWSFTASAWQNEAAGTGGDDEIITITLESNLTDFIDSSGYVYVLARTTNPSDGFTSAVLHCDYSECAVTVNGITYADIVSYRSEDQVNVKPFLWRTEFTVKTWLFEKVYPT